MVLILRRNSNNFAGGSLFLCRPLSLLLLLVVLSVWDYLPALVLIEGQFDHPGPIHLTNMKNGHHELDYLVFDQCLPRAEMRDGVQSYALEFKMPSKFLCGNEGLLICYPGQLDATNTESGVVMPINLRVKNAENNIVTEACKKRRREYCEQKPDDCEFGGAVGRVEWHGILVRTEDVGTLNISMSIAGAHSYRLRRDFMLEHFQIRLGSKWQFNTTIHYPTRKTRMNFPDEEVLRENYMQNEENGAYLKHYTGLWMLAVDMLPMEKQQTLHLFVYRDSQCSMQAWFVRPYDQNYQLPLKLNAGSEDDDTKGGQIIKPVEKSQFLGTFNKSEKIEIWMFVPFDDVDNYYTEIRVELTSSDGKLVFAADIRPDTIVYGPEGIDLDEKERTDTFDANVLKKSDHIRIGITKMDNSYKFTFVEGKVSKEKIIFPEDWYDNSPSKKAAQMNVTVKGNNIVIGKMERSQDKNTTVNIRENVGNFWKLDKTVTNGSKIIGKIKVLDDATMFEFNLLHDAPEWHVYMGATLMRIEWFKENDTADGNNTISWKAYHHRAFKIDYTTSSKIFVPGHFLKCVLTIFYVDSVTKNAIFDVEINDEKVHVFHGDLPIWTLNWLQLRGNIQILNKPSFEYGKENPDLFKHDFSHLLNYGDTICFETTLDKNITIFLFHEINEYSETIGDTLLRMHATTTEDTYMMDRRLNHETIWTKAKDMRGNPFKNRAKLPLSINVTDSKQQQYLLFDSTQRGSIASMEYNDAPPWLVNWIVLKGDMKEVNFFNESNHCKEKNWTALNPLPSNIKQLYPNNLLKVGDEIHIYGTVKKGAIIRGNQQDPEVAVFLLREALEWHERFGQTVLRVQFNKDELTLNSYIPNCNDISCTQDWQKNTANEPHIKIDMPLKAGQLFGLHIKALGKTMFDVHYKNYKLNYSDPEAPLWAAQYVVVLGLNEDVKFELK